MKKSAALLILLAVMTAHAQIPSQDAGAPQTARQALLEMFFSKTSGTFMKHLPAATLDALQKSGALSTLQGYSLLATQFQTKQTQQNSFATFDAGPVLLSGINAQSGEKYEVMVENDSLQGNADNITLSFHGYKDKQLQRTPYMPNLTFAMKMESGVWKLNEILLTIRLPLADPDVLKKITEGIKAQTNGIKPQITIGPGQPQAHVSATSFGSDASVIAAMRTIVAAETTYKGTYAAVGYTCTLSDLDGFGGGEANEHQAMLIGSDLAGGRRFGYTFVLSGCASSPASEFRLTASPGNSFGRRIYCANQSGTIRSSPDGNPASCFANGAAVQ
jgi:hypothetical protein